MKGFKNTTKTAYVTGKGLSGAAQAGHTLKKFKTGGPVVGGCGCGGKPKKP